MPPAPTVIPEELVEWVRENPDRSLTLKLETPVPFGKTTVEELVLKRPKAKHMRGFDRNSGTSEMLDMVGRLSEQPKAVIDELDGADAVRAQEVIALFFPNGPTAGKS